MECSRRSYWHNLLLSWILQRFWVGSYSRILTKYTLSINSIFQNYYLTHQLSDKTPSQISWIGSLQIFFLLSGNVIGGPLFDRFGGKTVWPPAAMFVFAVMMTSLCKEYYQFILCQGILGGVSMGMM